MLQLDEVNQAAAEGKEPAFGVHLDIASYGDMSSFFWAHSQPPPPGLIECDVAYGEAPAQRKPVKLHFAAPKQMLKCSAMRNAVPSERELCCMFGAER